LALPSYIRSPRGWLTPAMILASRSSRARSQPEPGVDDVDVAQEPASVERLVELGRVEHVVWVGGDEALQVAIAFEAREAVALHDLVRLLAAQARFDQL